MYGFHFLRNDCRLRYRDGRKVVVGDTLEMQPALTLHGKLDYPVLCQAGMHASKRFIDALKFAPGDVLTRVRLAGNIKHDTDKSVARRRTCLVMLKSKKVLRRLYHRMMLVTLIEAQSGLAGANATNETYAFCLKVVTRLAEGKPVSENALHTAQSKVYGYGYGWQRLMFKALKRTKDIDVNNDLKAMVAAAKCNIVGSVQSFVEALNRKLEKLAKQALKEHGVSANVSSKALLSLS